MIRKTVRGQDARTTRVSDQGCFHISNKNTIVVIGISGTGKSTISRKLAALKGLPLYHMDIPKLRRI
jgi:ABC-type oligopeptide transport system ATPase subunit